MNDNNLISKHVLMDVLYFGQEKQSKGMSEPKLSGVFIINWQIY